MTPTLRRPKVVLLGMLTKIPVGGVMWLIRQYAVGFERLGYDVYYVEAHGRVPSMFMADEHDDGTAKACAFIADVMKRFGMQDRWAFHALHTDGRCYGLSEGELHLLFREAALIVNLHGGTVPRDEHAATGRLVYMGTDPVELELELHRGEQHAIDFLEPHVAFFTWGLNYGNPDCRLPWSERFPFVPSPPPVVVDLWRRDGDGPQPLSFTTIGNWRQQWREVRFEGEIYTWSKHHEFLKILDLPRRVDQTFELALSSYTDEDRLLLERHGWRVRPGLELSSDPDSYQEYITASRGELTAAKDQNVRLRSGWFSERSATYLAAGRPVVQQDTGFGNAIPTGAGVFGFADVDGAAAAVETINADYEANSQAAEEIAREYFNYDVVLGDLLDHVGLDAPARNRSAGRVQPLHTAERVAGPVPTYCRRRPAAPFGSAVVVVSDQDLATVRSWLETVLAETAGSSFELVVVGNGTTAGTRQYLGVLAARNGNVQLVDTAGRVGPARARFEGIKAARGDVVGVLDVGAAVKPRWLLSSVDELQDAGELAGRI